MFCKDSYFVFKQSRYKTAKNKVSNNKKFETKHPKLHNAQTQNARCKIPPKSKFQSSVSEFNEFKPRLKSPQNRFQLSAS